MQMVSLTPEVIIAGGAAPTRALQQATHTIPIIITQGGDVAANGLVKDIAHPEGNITGFTSSEPTIAGKWLELLKAAVPSVARVAIVGITGAVNVSRGEAPCDPEHVQGQPQFYTGCTTTGTSTAWIRGTRYAGTAR